MLGLILTIICLLCAIIFTILYCNNPYGNNSYYVLSYLLWVALIFLIISWGIGCLIHEDNYLKLKNLKKEISYEKEVYLKIKDNISIDQSEIITKNIKYIQIKKLEKIVDEYNSLANDYFGKENRIVTFSFLNKDIYEYKPIEKDF